MISVAAIALAGVAGGGCECHGDEGYSLEVTVTDANTGALVHSVTFTTAPPLDHGFDDFFWSCERDRDAGRGDACPVWVVGWSGDAIEVSAPGYLSQALDVANLGTGDPCAGLVVQRSVQLTPKP